MQARRILLAVTGSIAAYKSVYLLRLLRKGGHEVRVLMTPAATEFVRPINFSVLSGQDVAVDVIDGDSWNNHVENGLWADLMIIAPCTANTMAAMVQGVADNVVLANWLSARCPVLIAPAMDLDMYHHPATQRNIKWLEDMGVHVMHSPYGELASGLVGDGRMAEPEEIIAKAMTISHDSMDEPGSLSGKKILLTAGPTQEAIDPVRYISNRSTGQMGIALANACAARGGKVFLVLGPVEEQALHPNVEKYPVISANEMFDQAYRLFPEVDVAIFTAAVADYRPKKQADQKLKKKAGGWMSMEWVENPDIAAELGKIKKKDQLTVGFALETHDESENARLKLNNKNFDLIVLNSLQDKGAGFGGHTNQVTIMHRDGSEFPYPLLSKKETAENILNHLQICLAQKG